MKIWEREFSSGDAWREHQAILERAYHNGVRIFEGLVMAILSLSPRGD